MITLKFRTRHVPTTFIDRKGIITSGRKADGRIEYELNPETVPEIMDELCDKIIELKNKNSEYQQELIQLRPKRENIPTWDGARVFVGGGYGD